MLWLSKDHLLSTPAWLYTSPGQFGLQNCGHLNFAMTKGCMLSPDSPDSPGPEVLALRAGHTLNAVIK